MKVGILGTGKLGRAIGERMLDKEIALRCWNRSPQSRDVLGRLADGFEPSLEQVTKDCDVLLLVVRDDAAALDLSVKLVVLPLAGKLIVNMGTVRPQTAIALGERFSQAGAPFLDAPVSGTIAPARAGQLLVLCGGDATLQSRINPLFEVLGRRTVWLGPVGAGSTMKFVLNLMLSTYWEVLSEALTLGQAGGLGTDQMLDVIIDSPAALPIVAPKREHIAGRGGPASVDLARASQEMLLIEQTAREFGVPTPAASAAATMMKVAVASGFGDKDVAELTQFWLSRMSAG